MALAPHTECMTARPVTLTGHLTHLTVLCDLHLLSLRHLGDMEVTLWDPQQEKTPRSIRGKQTEGNSKHPLLPSCLAASCPGECAPQKALKSRELRFHARAAAEMCAQPQFVPQPRGGNAHHMTYGMC